MQEQASISVITPTYNSARYLPEAIGSVKSQTLQPLEIIVIDDGSTDHTESIISKLPAEVRYIRQENRGPSFARNRGLEVARGELIAFIDADDLWPENKLALQLQVLQENPDTDVVVGYVQWMLRKDLHEEEPTFENYSKPFPSFNLGSALFKKSVFDQVGFFNPELQYSEDVDWFFRAREKNIHILIHEEIALYYRIHENNISKDKLVRQSFFLRTIKESLNRRRQSTDEGPGKIAGIGHIPKQE